MIKCLKISAYLLGAIIGAGFASGKEIVSFLGKDGLGIGNAVVCAIFVFVLCGSFLLSAHFAGGGGFSAVNKTLFPRMHCFFDICVAFNALIVLSAMTAVVTEIGNNFYPLKQIYSVVFLLFVVFIVYKGQTWVLNGSYIMMFFIVAVIIAVSTENFSSGESILEQRFSVKNCFSYISMNMFLSAGAMLSHNRLSKRQRVAVAGIVAVCVGALIFTLAFAIRCAGCEGENIPIFALSSRLGKIAYYLSVVLLILSAITTSTAAVSEVSHFLSPVTGKKTALSVAVIAGFTLSLFGFEKVVEQFYPVIGILGGIYFIFVFKYLAVALFNKFFHKRNGKVHDGGK